MHPSSFSANPCITCRLRQTSTPARVLVDAARSKLAAKRGGEFRRVKLGDSEVAFDAPDVLAVDDALTLLETQNSKAAAVVRLRYFGGCDPAETAALLELSKSTVERRWCYARAWLHRRMEAEG